MPLHIFFQVCVLSCMSVFGLAVQKVLGSSACRKITFYFSFALLVFICDCGCRCHFDRACDTKKCVAVFDWIRFDSFFYQSGVCFVLAFGSGEATDHETNKNIIER